MKNKEKSLIRLKNLTMDKFVRLLNYQESLSLRYGFDFFKVSFYPK